MLSEGPARDKVLQRMGNADPHRARVTLYLFETEAECISTVYFNLFQFPSVVQASHAVSSQITDMSDISKSPSLPTRALKVLRLRSLTLRQGLAGRLGRGLGHLFHGAPERRQAQGDAAADAQAEAAADQQRSRAGVHACGNRGRTDLHYVVRPAGCHRKRSSATQGGTRTQSFGSLSLELNSHTVLRPTPLSWQASRRCRALKTLEHRLTLRQARQGGVGRRRRRRWGKIEINYETMKLRARCGVREQKRNVALPGLSAESFLDAVAGLTTPKKNARSDEDLERLRNVAEAESTDLPGMVAFLAEYKEVNELELKLQPVFSTMYRAALRQLAPAPGQTSKLDLQAWHAACLIQRSINPGFGFRAAGALG